MTLNLFDQSIEQFRKLPFQIPHLEGYSYLWNNELNGYDIQIPQGELFYSEGFFNQAISDKYWDYLLELEGKNTNKVDWRNRNLNELTFKNIQWSQDVLKMYGKTILAPRYSAWYGDEGKNYSYSGLHLTPKSWNEGLLDLKRPIDNIAQTTFNSVLLNWYRDGEDYMGWHCDDEKELGQNPIIASLNLGATRRFLFRKKSNNSEKIEFHLKHGSLLIMRGEIQHFWQHAAPKEKAVKEARINLTFRVIK
ncbi:alpha-ketoglutarate-dependent dioxygenase AlkB family protein [Aquirufa sp. ROCK-SH2]